MKTRFLWILGTIALGCTTPEPFQPAVHGLASPIRLQARQTLFQPEDYFAGKAAELDSVRWPEGMAAAATDSGWVVIAGQPQTSVTVARFYLDGVRYDIPVFRSARRSVELRVEGIKAREVYAFGTFNAWNRGQLPMVQEGGVWKANLELEPGKHEYRLMVDGKERTDPGASDSVSNGMGGYNSVYELEGDPEALSPLVADQMGKNFVSLEPVNEGQQVVGLWENHEIEPRTTFENGKVVYNFPIPNAAFRMGRTHLRIYTGGEYVRGNDVLIPLERGQVITDAAQLNRSDWPAAVLYFAFVDRFLNGRADNDKPVADPEIHPKANYQGGDIDGLRRKIDEGFFEELGVNGIWISPLSRNPEGAYGLWDKGGVKSKFSGYHGYWPVSNTQPDPRLGSKDEMLELVRLGHEKNLNLLIDYVANHVHEENPIYRQHPDWATPLHLPDGSLNTERWDEHRLTTWFDVFMPTLELRDPKIAGPMADTALVWVKDYGFDGFRHDATKHISEVYWRSLTRKIKDSLPDREVFQIGETYGSPDLIASYLSSGMLDAQFDFNVYDAAVGAFSGQGPVGAGLKRLVEVETQSLAQYGAHNRMGYISGNQDRPRFITLASGDVLLSEDAKLAGWTREIPIPDDTAYARLALLHAFNMAIPGIPVIYYGDEIGLHGAGDPDNRKMMKFSNLSAPEQRLREDVIRLVHLRRGSMALTYGTTEIGVLSGDVLYVRRSYFDQEAVVLINPNANDVSIDPKLIPARLKARFGHLYTESGDYRIPAFSFDYVL